MDPVQVGRYRLTARLGAGGMGMVYLGTSRDGSLVAVKVLRPELADDPEFRDRFGREVQWEREAMRRPRRFGGEAPGAGVGGFGCGI